MISCAAPSAGATASKAGLVRILKSSRPRGYITGRGGIIFSSDSGSASTRGSSVASTAFKRATLFVGRDDRRGSLAVAAQRESVVHSSDQLARGFDLVAMQHIDGHERVFERGSGAPSRILFSPKRLSAASRTFIKRLSSSMAFEPAVPQDARRCSTNSRAARPDRSEIADASEKSVLKNFVQRRVLVGAGGKSE